MQAAAPQSAAVRKASISDPIQAISIDLSAETPQKFESFIEIC